MFNPDICGAGHKIVHFILNKRGENRLIKRNVAAESDEFTHTYTAVLNKDNTCASRHSLFLSVCVGSPSKMIFSGIL